MAWAGQAAALSWGPYGTLYCFHIPEVGDKLKKSCPEDDLVSQGTKGRRKRQDR